MSAPASAARAAVLGSPIAHSLSPALHRAAYAALGLDWSYDAYDVGTAHDLAAFLDRLDSSWVGLSLTMPLKPLVLPLCDEISPLARAVEAVNTVVLRAGRRSGENTDVPGMVAALAERGVPGDRPVAAAGVLGGGATAASAVAALHQLGVAEVAVFVRSARRAAEAHALAERLGRPVDVQPWDAAAAALAADLVVSTVPAGVADLLAAHVPDRAATLFDVLYAPWPTPLAAAWAARGGLVVSGFDLLLHQAVLQVELMTGRRPGPLAAMRAALPPQRVLGREHAAGPA